MLLACQNISKAFGTKEVLKDINFHVNEKEKIAIVGINGSGKTTLLKIIMGEESADSGQIVIAKDTTIGYLSQHQDISFDNTIYGEMLATKQYILDLEANIRRLEQDMKHAEGAQLEKILETYNRLSSKYDRDNGYSYESEITGVLKGLGFGPEDYDRHINTLSGGQKMRIALGRLLLTRPDIIILDEPTNHLDMPSISWLESFLSSYPGSVIVVSHDRYFIDRIATQIVEIDNKKATIYHGNYTYFASKAKKDGFEQIADLSEKNYLGIGFRLGLRFFGFLAVQLGEDLHKREHSQRDKQEAYHRLDKRAVIQRYLSDCRCDHSAGLIENFFYRRLEYQLQL